MGKEEHKPVHLYGGNPAFVVVDTIANKFAEVLVVLVTWSVVLIELGFQFVTRRPICDRELAC